MVYGLFWKIKGHAPFTHGNAAPVWKCQTEWSPLDSQLCMFLSIPSWRWRGSWLHAEVRLPPSRATAYLDPLDQPVALRFKVLLHCAVFLDMGRDLTSGANEFVLQMRPTASPIGRHNRELGPHLAAMYRNL
jgi:hypothetical protein